MGVEGNPRISEEKGLLPPFSGFPRCSADPPEKGEKGRKRAKRADFGRFPGRAARHPLSPHLLHPHLRQPKFPLGCSGPEGPGRPCAGRVKQNIASKDSSGGGLRGENPGAFPKAGPIL